MDDQGRRVDEMIAEGLRIVREAVEEHRPVATVAAYSGGDDSVVSTHFAMENLPGCVAFNADTLIGLGPAREHIARTCGRFGWGLEVERAECSGCPKKRRHPELGMIPFEPARDLVAGEWRDGATAYEEFVLNWGFPGRSKAMHSRMYQRLKQRPLRSFVRRIPGRRRGQKVLIVSGIRHDESAIRAGYKRAYAVDESAVWVNPFYWRTAADFAAYRDEFGLPRNPVKPRCGVSGECMCNTFPNENNTIPAIEAVDPGFASYVSGLEAQVREVFPWGYGQSPPSWWADHLRGQMLMFDAFDGVEALSSFQPMCVGCERSGRK